MGKPTSRPDPQSITIQEHLEKTVPTFLDLLHNYALCVIDSTHTTYETRGHKTKARQEKAAFRRLFRFVFGRYPTEEEYERMP